MFLTIKAK